MSEREKASGMAGGATRNNSISHCDYNPAPSGKQEIAPSTHAALISQANERMTQAFDLHELRAELESTIFGERGS